MSTTRRSFLLSCASSVAGAALNATASAVGLGSNGGTSAHAVGRTSTADAVCLPPLFCTAYITPDAPGQGGQEAMVARYPLALVPQDTRIAFVRWRDRVRNLNPSILLLGYLVVIEEAGIPGPGHDRLRKINNAWCEYPGGVVPTVKPSPFGPQMRIYDPRNKGWQQGFLDACRVTLASYPYAGLFLDQCTVYQRAHPLESTRAEMRQALQETLLQLRREFPDALLVGNSSYNWTGLNGELNEGRRKDLPSELKPYPGHVPPRLELYQSLLRSPYDTETVKKDMAMAHAYGASYGAAVDYQHVLWFEFFDDVMAACKR